MVKEELAETGDQDCKEWPDWRGDAVWRGDPFRPTKEEWNLAWSIDGPGAVPGDPLWEQAIRAAWNYSMVRRGPLRELAIREWRTRAHRRLKTATVHTRLQAQEGLIDGCTVVTGHRAGEAQRLT